LVALSTTVGVLAQQQPCAGVKPYLGFDSRLRVDVAGRVAPTSDEPIGFEVAGSRPVVAYEHRLVAVDGNRLVGYPSLDRISALAVDRSGGLWLQTSDKIRRFGADQLVAAGTLSSGARIHNSGAGAFLVVRPRSGVARLAFRAADGTATPALELEGAFRTASLNSEGLSAVVDDSLIVWPSGSQSVRRLAEDVAFRGARDVVLIGENRAVVTLSNLVVLQTDQNLLVLAAMKARARWQNGSLYLLDERSGVIWKIDGLDGLGTPAGDFAHAARLVKQAPDEVSNWNSPAFQEAARIVGCERARDMRK
jgi:hypothetical protein